MKAKITAILALLAITLTGPALVPSGAVYAACKDTASKQAVIDSIGQAGQGECDDKGVSSIVNTIVSILSYVAGITAIIMILISGFRYITSGGDSGKVSAAKNALIYAVVGIVIAVLAQLIVRVVVAESDNAVNNKGCSIGFHRKDGDPSNDCVKN